MCSVSWSASFRISPDIALSLPFFFLYYFFRFLFFPFVWLPTEQPTNNGGANPIPRAVLFSLCRVSCYWRRVTRERKFRSRIQSTTAITDTIEWGLGSTAWENLTGVWSAVVIHIYTDGPATVELENWDRVKRRGSPEHKSEIYTRRCINRISCLLR